jgi:hypothetical protein
MMHHEPWLLFLHLPADIQQFCSYETVQLVQTDALDEQLAPDQLVTSRQIRVQ